MRVELLSHTLVNITVFTGKCSLFTGQPSSVTEFTFTGHRQMAASLLTTLRRVMFTLVTRLWLLSGWNYFRNGGQKKSNIERVSSLIKMRIWGRELKIATIVDCLAWPSTPELTRFSVVALHCFPQLLDSSLSVAFRSSRAFHMLSIAVEFRFPYSSLRKAFRFICLVSLANRLRQVTLNEKFSA